MLLVAYGPTEGQIIQGGMTAIGNIVAIIGLVLHIWLSIRYFRRANAKATIESVTVGVLAGVSFALLVAYTFHIVGIHIGRLIDGFSLYPGYNSYVAIILFFLVYLFLRHITPRVRAYKGHILRLHVSLKSGNNITEDPSTPLLNEHITPETTKDTLRLRKLTLWGGIGLVLGIIINLGAAILFAIMFEPFCGRETCNTFPISISDVIYLTFHYPYYPLAGLLIGLLIGRQEYKRAMRKKENNS